jgi:carbon monoxide dehydrogenase subunit G
MATIRKEIHTTATPSAAWEALRDVGALHLRLVVGFVTATRLEGPDRIVTFANGMEARERIVAVDDAKRRVAYSVIGGRFTHHNASAEVLPDGAGSTIVWTADMLPDDVVPTIEGMMDAGAAAMKRTLDRSRQ